VTNRGIIDRNGAAYLRTENTAAITAGLVIADGRVFNGHGSPVEEDSSPVAIGSD
jgi:hypothetical protein